MESAFCGKVGAKCGRWNPTAEQVKVLMDLFASGLRTPTTDQIQKISSHLSAFGKIESKNVFYWFQNHKARDRHHKKRRRGSDGGGGDICVITPENKKEPRNIDADSKEFEQDVLWEQGEREIETLELFPLSSYEQEKTKTMRNEWRQERCFSEIAGPLDLRLSFL